MRKTIYKLHKFAGLTLGIFIFLLALSGVLITFREELLPVVYSEFRIEKGEIELHPARVIESAQKYLGERKVTNFYASGEPDEASLILFRDAKHTLPEILVMNPYTGVAIGEMPVWKNVFAVALFFHANFFLGKTGEWMIGILGFVLVLFVITGLFIWLPKKNVLRKLKATFDGKFSPQKIHHQLGLILAIPLFISALTGALIIFDLSYLVMKNVQNHPDRPDELTQVKTCDFNKDMQALSLLNETQLKNLISIHLCNKKNSFIKVSYGIDSRHPTDGYSRVLIDSETQQVVQSFDSTKDPSSWNLKRMLIYPIHSGEYFGMPGKILVFISGLGLMMIFITGIILSLNRSARNRTVL